MELKRINLEKKRRQEGVTVSDEMQASAGPMRTVVSRREGAARAHDRTRGEELSQTLVGYRSRIRSR